MRDILKYPGEKSDEKFLPAWERSLESFAVSAAWEVAEPPQDSSVLHQEGQAWEGSGLLSLPWGLLGREKARVPVVTGVDFLQEWMGAWRT